MFSASLDHLDDSHSFWLSAGICVPCITQLDITSGYGGVLHQLFTTYQLFTSLAILPPTFSTFKHHHPPILPFPTVFLSPPHTDEPVCCGGATVARVPPPCASWGTCATHTAARAGGRAGVGAGTGEWGGFKYTVRLRYKVEIYCAYEMFLDLKHRWRMYGPRSKGLKAEGFWAGVSTGHRSTDHIKDGW